MWQTRLSSNLVYVALLCFLLRKPVMVASKREVSAKPQKDDLQNGIQQFHTDSQATIINDETGKTTEFSRGESGRSREKRHTADHLISDKYSRSLKSQARKQILSKLLNLVGSSPDNPCECLFAQSTSDKDSSSRLIERDVFKRLDSISSSSFKCNCDISSLIKFILSKLKFTKKSNTDPLGRYMSMLSEATKTRLAHFLHEEELRLKKNEILRKLRIRRMHRMMMHRRRLLHKDPRAAFRGKQFFSF